MVLDTYLPENMATMATPPMSEIKLNLNKDNGGIGK
jgi:hypothetical protein